MQKTNEFLGEYNLTAEQLNESQKDCLFSYINEERGVKGYVQVVIVCIIFFIIASLYCIPVMKFAVGNLAINAVKVNDDGKERCIQLDKQAKEIVTNYGLICAVMGFLWGSITYALLVNGAVETVFSVRRLRDKKKIFEAFLPAVKAAPQ